MIYKFNSGGSHEKEETFLELSQNKQWLMLYSGNYENYMGNVHYLHPNEIDDMIIALSNIKNDIAAWKREHSKREK